MRIIKRWATTVTSSFDWMISQVENHEALVGSAIKEIREAGSKARVQLNRVRQDGEQIKRRLAELREMESVWTERAVKIHETDRDKALQCLKRRKQIQREIQHLEKQIIEHSRLERQLTKDLGLIEEKISGLKRKKNALSARQYRAEVIRVGQSESLGTIAEIDEIFDRWEVKIGQIELYEEPDDSLDEEFRTEEEQQELEDALEQLIEEQENRQE